MTGLLVRDNGSSTDLYVAVGTRGFSTTVQGDLAENGANGIYRATVPPAAARPTGPCSARPDNGWPAGTGSGIPGYQPGGNTLGRIDMAIAPSNRTNVPSTPRCRRSQPGGGRPAAGQLGVWRTTDGGTTWQQRSDSRRRLNPGSGARDYPQNWYDQGVAVDPNNPDTGASSTPSTSGNPPTAARPSRRNLWL